MTFFLAGTVISAIFRTATRHTAASCLGVVVNRSSLFVERSADSHAGRIRHA